MVKKKRVILPKDFGELVKAGDIEKLKAVYKKCELYAHDGRCERNTALHYSNVPDEFVRWLTEQGLDVNVENYYGRSPLDRHAALGDNTVKLLFELGADVERVDRYGNSPLHTAASFFHSNTVRFLVEKGANVYLKNDMDQIPLASCLAVCSNLNIPEVAEIADILLQAGDKVTLDMIESVKRIGQDFEFHREDFNKDYLSETDLSLKKLYLLFEVEPVEKRRIHDGVSPIIVENSSWEKQYNMLWDFLVPSSGVAKTVQGEVIRITGRIRDELYRNGGTNWDKDYQKMLDALLVHFASGTSLSECELNEIRKLTTSIRAKGDVDEEITDCLCEFAVQWVLKNPNPISLNKPSYDR